MMGGSNGVFVSFLIGEMCKQKGVLVKAMLENLQQRFRTELSEVRLVEIEHIGSRLLPEGQWQIPEVTSTLAEPLSLDDPVDRNSIGLNFFSLNNYHFCCHKIEIFLFFL